MMHINIFHKAGSGSEALPFGEAKRPNHSAGKKLSFIIPVMLLLAAACNRQTVIKPGTEQQTITAPASGTQPKQPATTIKPSPAKPFTNVTETQPKAVESYSNIQNSSTVSSTIIQNSSSINNSQTINLNLDASSFPAAAVGRPYSSRIAFQQSGNQQIFVEFKGLPPGLGLAADGSGILASSMTIQNPGQTPSLTLAGTPTQAGDYNVSLKLDNQNGTIITQQFTLTINP